MADTKITALTALTGADPANDVIPIVDVSDTTMAASGTTKKISVNNILGASGTATLASATITGDLTVDTSTLKVDSANNRVGIGTATPASALHMRNASGTGIFTQYQDTGGINYVGIDNGLFRLANTTAQDLITIAQSGVFSFLDGAGGTRMTLNSTGLGIGTVGPVAKLEVNSASITDVDLKYNMVVRSSDAYTTSPKSGIAFAGFFNGSANIPLCGISGGKENGVLNDYGSALYFSTRPNGGSITTRLTIDSSGNCGIGVQPSAWTTSYNALNIGSGGSIAAYKSANYDQFYVGSNFFENTSGAWRFINNGYATQYWHNSGSHVWRISTTSNAAGANQPLTWTSAMTLDASGNLLVTKTSYGLSVGFAAASTGSIDSVMASAVSAQSTLNVYSTGAAAYRFYVGMNGTINATNTTISAISDARLKENVQDIDVGLGAILALKPRKFDWKAGKGKDIKGDRGFIAQEFEQVFPNLIDEWKDPAPEGEAPYKSVRQDLIPVLVKAIQELTARVQTLETR